MRGRRIIIVVNVAHSFARSGRLAIKRKHSLMLPLFVLLFPFVGANVLERTRTHHVYWNSTNPMFEPFSNAIDSPGYYSVVADAGDTVRIHCPRRERGAGQYEYLMVWQVSRSAFERCALEKKSRLVAVCDKTAIDHTVNVVHKRGQGEMYFISTSSGSLPGMEQRRHGLCLEKNIRMMVHWETAADLIRPDANIYLSAEYVREMLSRGLVLVEENGVIGWKMNILPDEEVQQRVYPRLRFDRTRHIDPIPLYDDHINSLQDSDSDDVDLDDVRYVDVKEDFIPFPEMQPMSSARWSVLMTAALGFLAIL